MGTGWAFPWKERLLEKKTGCSPMEMEVNRLLFLNPVFQKIIAQADCKNSPAVRWGKRDRA